MYCFINICKALQVLNRYTSQCYNTSGIEVWKSSVTGSWFCCFLCSCSEESWPGGVRRASDRWESAQHRYRFVSSFPIFLLFCVKNKANQLSVLLSDDPDTVRAARRDSTCSFYQPPPPTDIERMRNNMIKEQKVFALIREILGRKTTLVLNNKVCDELQFWDADVRYLFVMQPTWVLCGCCFWWRTVRGTPMRIFWPNTSDRASAKRSQTVWVFRMCSSGQTQLCWATCLGSTQVSMLWSYKQLHTTA